MLKISNKGVKTRIYSYINYVDISLFIGKKNPKNHKKPTMLKHVCTQKYGDVVEQYFEHDLYGDCLAILTM
jgi:hypothetical protein